MTLSCERQFYLLSFIHIQRKYDDVIRVIIMIMGWPHTLGSYYQFRCYIKSVIIVCVQETNTVIQHTK
jgi:hypothetical protein